MKIEFKGDYTNFISYGIPVGAKWDRPSFANPKFIDIFYIIPMEETFHFVKFEDIAEPILVLDREAHDFVRLLDGSVTLDEALALLHYDFPDCKRKLALDVFQRLVDLDLIIEGAIERSGTFSDGYFLRQERQIRFLSHFETNHANRFDYQNRIFEAKVLVLGIGGTGSQALLFLAAAGFGNITAVDFDAVDPSNLNRQLLFNDSDIGRKKAEAAKERIAAFNPHIRINTICEKLLDVEQVACLMSGHDICLCCADVPPILIRDRINRASVRTGVPVIYGGIYADHVNIGPLVVPGKTGCFQCWNETRRQLDENYGHYMDYILERETELGSSAANVWLYGTTGAGIAMGMGGIVMDVMRFISGYAPPKTMGVQLKLNLLSLETEKLAWPRIATCPVCGALDQPKG